MGSETRRRKALGAMGPLLAPGVSVRAYAVGRANARMTTAVTYVIAGLLLVLVVVAVLTGHVYLPGLLVFVLFFPVIKPGRGVAVLDAVVVVVSVKAMTGKPRAVLGELAPAVLLPPHIHWVAKRAVQIPLGPDIVKFRARDYERLTASLSTPFNSPAATPPC